MHELNKLFFIITTANDFYNYGEFITKIKYIKLEINKKNKMNREYWFQANKSFNKITP